jgi:hypothetical protein
VGLRSSQLAHFVEKMESVSGRASEVAGVQDSNKTTDAWVTGAAIVLFWPAAFFVKGDGPTAAELARLKGEFEALEKATIEELRFAGARSILSRHGASSRSLNPSSSLSAPRLPPK